MEFCPQKFNTRQTFLPNNNPNNIRYSLYILVHITDFSVHYFHKCVTLLYTFVRKKTRNTVIAYRNFDSRNLNKEFKTLNYFYLFINGIQFDFS